MSSKRLRISRPTKYELLRLKRRLSTYRRMHRILRDRLFILSQEFFRLLIQAKSLRENVNRLLSDAYSEYVACRASHPYPAFYLDVISEPRVLVKERSIAGVRGILVEYVEEEEARGTGCIAKVSESMRRALREVSKLAEVEETLLMLGEEIRRARRRVNALEYILIPRIESTIRVLESRFEEKEREEKVRLKKVKTMLEARRGTSIEGHG